MRTAHFTATVPAYPSQASTQGCRTQWCSVCAAVARRLHNEGTIERVFGRTIPIGFGFLNDIDEAPLAAHVKAANPDHISKPIEEWLLGESYEQIEERKLLLAHLASQPPTEQAQFWMNAELAQYRKDAWNEDSPLSQQLEDCTLQWGEKRTPYMSRVLPELAPLLIEALAPRASNSFPHSYRGTTEEKEIEFAVHLAYLLATLKGDHAAVPQSAIDQLEAIFRGLWSDAKARLKRGEQLGMCLRMIANALHSLRPGQFPPVRFESHTSGGFNFADFGLTL